MQRNHPRSTRLELPRRMLVWLFLATSLWYLAWRTSTFNAQAPLFSALVYAAEVYGFVSAALHIFMCWRLSERRAPPPHSGITVDVFVPTYNESVALVRKTLLAAQAMDYPHRTWLLDDGRREEMRALARELGCDYLARGDNAHAKAGNLNNALWNSQGQFVAVFDADHAPRRDFLTKTLGYFNDPAVAFVQTPQDYYNLDSYQHRWRGKQNVVWTEQSLFFRVIQRGKDYWNAAFFCGSCAIVRRSALEHIGGFATGTVTEDLHTSLRLHAAGCKSVYHAEPLAFGLAPESIEPFIQQRVRWGQGAMHVWRMEGILTHKGLSWAQRLNYLASVMTYFDGWQKAVFYTAPVVVLLSGTLPLLTSTPAFLLHFIPYYLLTFWVFEEVGRGYGRTWFIEQYNMARFAAFAWATLAAVFPHRKFRVTPKGMLARSTLRFTLPQWLVMGLNLLAIPVGIGLYLHAQALPLEGLIANSLWAAINGVLALAVVAYTAVMQRRKRLHYRFAVPLAAEFDFDGIQVRGTIDDLSDNGLRFYGVLPPCIERGQNCTGRLTLPDGPLEFVGTVRSLIPLPDHPDKYKGFGCSLTMSQLNRQRIERFLFGSDLQWTVNGLRDQVETPLSRLLPGRVTPPRHSPFANARWNAAEITAPGLQPVAVVTSLRNPQGEAWLLSFTELPEDCPLAMESFRRTGASGTIQLQCISRLEQAGFSLYVYRIATDDRILAIELADAGEQVAAA